MSDSESSDGEVFVVPTPKAKQPRARKNARFTQLVDAEVEKMDQKTAKTVATASRKREKAKEVEVPVAAALPPPPAPAYRHESGGVEMDSLRSLLAGLEAKLSRMEREPPVIHAVLPPAPEKKPRKPRAPKAAEPAPPKAPKKPHAAPAPEAIPAAPKQLTREDVIRSLFSN